MRVASGARIHSITLENPGAPVPDGGGGYSESWVSLLPPTAFASVEAATARSLESLAAGTIIATATHLVRMPYHPQVTIETRIRFQGRTLQVINRTNPDERNIELILVCSEQLGAAAPATTTGGVFDPRVFDTTGRTP
jgi:head-tail adaptor